MKKLLIAFCLLSTFNVYSQGDEPEINVAGIRFLDFKNDLPDNLLMSKSVVLLQLPAESKTSSIRKDWKHLAETAHKVFQETGIDAVAYYFMDDVIAGLESRQSFASEMKSRGVEFLIILSDLKLKIKNNRNN